MTAAPNPTVLAHIRERFPQLAAESGPLTEHRGALVFRDRHANELLYDHGRQTWLALEEGIWRPQRTALAHDYARQVASDLAAASDKVGERRTAERASFVAGLLTHAKADRAFARWTDDFDADRDLLGVPGGAVNLRTGQLLPPDPTLLLTRSAAVRPADGGCPLWLRFLHESTGGDAALVRFLKLWCGYCLTGNVDEHALVFVYGPGGNGKSVFLNVVAGVMGDYAVTAAMDTFTASKFDKHSTDLAMLAGARLVTASETDEGKAWAEARIKQMTGGDRITARFMRQDNFQFDPQFKLTIVGNHQPTLNNVDDALRRRFNIVPFERKPANPDRELETKLKAERPAILAWMIEGCLEWRRVRLIRPESVTAATATYFSEQDLFQQWLDDECRVEPGNVHLTETTARLFASWEGYAKAAGEAAGSKKGFAPNMRRRGLHPHRLGSARLFRGVQLRHREGDDG